MYIYILKLEKNKYYVGKSSKLYKRLDDHFNSYGSSWTKKYKPIKVIQTIDNCDKFDEDKYTLKYMEKYGIHNVRGGSFCETKLNNDNLKTINKMLDSASDNCYNCGEKGHFASQCEYYTDDSDDSEEEIWCCSYCDKEFTTEKGASFHENVHCKFKNNYNYKSSYNNKKINCYRCGREGHYSNDCYATKHIKGYWLD
jgi:predicted GIY-YIG superfamily endonuclease